MGFAYKFNMMRSYFYLLVCICMLHYKAQAQANYLDTLYRFRNFADIVDPNSGVLQLNDTSYVIASTVVAPNHYNQLILFAINLKGDTLWIRSPDYTNVGTTISVQCIFDNDKNILVAGDFGIDSVPNSVTAMIFKADSTGNVQWFKTYGIAHYSAYHGVYGYAPIATFDNHYLVVAALDDSVNVDFLIIKTDTAGNEESRWQYGTPKYDLPQAGIQTLDSGFLFAGFTTFADVPAYYLYSVYIVKTDKNGVLLWDTIYSAPSDSNGVLLADAVANDVIEATDGYIICGNRFARKNNIYPYTPWAYQKAWIAKLNKLDGSIIWEQNIGIDNATYQRFYKMTATSDGGYAACGVQIFSDQTTGDCWLVKMNAQGDSLWSRRFYYGNDDSLTTVFYNILQTHDNGYILTGYANPNYGPVFPWVVITDSMGCLIPRCDTLTATGMKETPAEILGVTVYPNPASNVVYILMKADEEINDLAFNVYDINGKLLLHQQHAATDVTYLLNTSAYAKGLYLVDVLSDGKVVATRKFVKE